MHLIWSNGWYFVHLPHLPQYSFRTCTNKTRNVGDWGVARQFCNASSRIASVLYLHARTKDAKFQRDPGLCHLWNLELPEARPGYDKKKSSSFRECSPKFLERRAFSGRFLKKPQSSPIFSCKALHNFDETSYISYRNKISFSMLSSSKKTLILVFSLMGQPGSNKVYYRLMDWSICLSVCFLSAMDCYADLCFTCLMFSLTSFGPPWGPFFHSTGRSSGP